MLIVADSSPVNILIRLGCVEVLGSLFGRVIIPPQVRDELSDSKTPDSVRALLIDDRNGRREATQRGIAVIGMLTGA